MIRANGASTTRRRRATSTRSLAPATAFALCAIAVVTGALAVHRGLTAPSPADVNLIANGSAEVGAVGRTPTGWTSRNIVVAPYALPHGAEMGSHYFYGGTVHHVPEISSATQIVSLQRYAHLIDAGDAEATLEGRLGGRAEELDSAVVTASFVRSVSDIRALRFMGHLLIGPVTPAERSYTRIFIDMVDSGTVPRGARYALITLNEEAYQGPRNNGYADYLSLHVSAP